MKKFDNWVKEHQEVCMAGAGLIASVGLFASGVCLGKFIDNQSIARGLMITHGDGLVKFVTKEGVEIPNMGDAVKYMTQFYKNR